MGKLSSLFGILATLLAIAAAVLSFLIASRRDEFRGRADKLAVAVTTMVGHLDNESNTNIQNDVSFTPADPASGQPESGTLGWQAYHDAKDESGAYADFQQTLDRATQFAQSMNQQRNDLAETIAEVGRILQIPDTALDPAHLKDLGDPDHFSEAVTAVTAHADAVARRDEAMIQTLVRASADIDNPIDKTALTVREETPNADGNMVLGQYPVRGPLDSFGFQVQGLKQRCDAYAETLVGAINRVTEHEWEAKPNQVAEQRGYERALTDLLNDFDAINDKLAQYEVTKMELERQKQKVAQLSTDMDRLREQLEDTEEQLARAKQRINQLLARLPDDMRQGMELEPTGDVDPNRIDPNLTGTILEVNEEWNFVILDLGSRHVREDLELLVARGDRLIAKVVISKVLGKVSVAEILPEVRTATVQAGDRVILPTQLQDQTLDGSE